MIKYSIIIPTHNNGKVLDRCLLHLSLLNNPEEEFEVIVADNGSNDNTKEITESYKNKIKNLNYLLEESLGLHMARHKGLCASRGEILCYIDDDSFVDKNWLRAIEATFSDNSVHLATGEIKPCFDAKPPKWFKYMWEEGEWGKYLYKYSLITLHNKFMEIPHGFVFGCNFIIRKEDVIKMKGFNPDGLPDMYMKYRGDGESALAGKLNNVGIKAWYNPKISIKHYVPKKRLTKEYLLYRAKRSGISSSFSDLRSEYGIFKYKQETAAPPKKFVPPPS